MSVVSDTSPRLFTLMMLTGLSVLSLTLFLPSLASIADEFQADFALVNLSIAGYLAITAVLQLIVGPLSDRYGRRPLILGGLLIFIVGSVGCMLATNIEWFLIFRVLQSAIVSGSALSFAVIRDTANEREAASKIAYVSTAMAVAPMTGPAIGGFLEEAFGWRASFIVFAVLGVIVFIMCWVDLAETNKSPSATLRQQLRSYPELIGSRRFWGYALCLAFSTGAFYSFLSGAPLVAKSVLALSPAMLGMYLGILTAGFIVGTFASGLSAKYFSLTTMVMAGRLIACAGSAIGLLLVLAGYVNVLTIFGAAVVVGVGNGVTKPSGIAGAMSVRPALAGSAAGLLGAMTVGGGAIITTISGAILTESNSPYALLGLMLACSFIALLAALYVVKIDRELRSETSKSYTSTG